MMTAIETSPTRAAWTAEKLSALEVEYLRPVLEALASEQKSALDVGAHKGDFTAALVELGFKVLAVEPQDYMADRFAARHAGAISARDVVLARCAASDHRGQAELIIGSASTVSTLEAQWTSVAFPEEFRSPRKVTVPVVPLCDLLADQNFDQVGFAKIDVEGHELPALSGLFDPHLAPPAIVMFEANQRFPQQAIDCLALLRAQGYRRFDIIIRIGLDPVAGERFSQVQLPQSWRACGERYFYANVIGYHESLDGAEEGIDPARFVKDYQLDKGRALLQKAIEIEKSQPVPVHPVWQTACNKLRDYLLTQSWHDFLRNPVCKEMFVRGRWSAAQDRELETIERSALGRDLLQRLCDPEIGAPRSSERLAGISTNLLGMIWYITRIHRQAGGTLPQRVVEVGGGYGALAFTYARTVPSAQYIIIDLPEMLAIQHYFLTLTLPDHSIVFAESADAIEPKPGQITLVPVSLIDETRLAAPLAGRFSHESHESPNDAKRLASEAAKQISAPDNNAVPFDCDLLISTFALSEMPRELQRRIENARYFGAKRLFITGQLSTQYPDINLVSHGDVVGGAMQRFPRLQVERFHVGDNYLLLGERDHEEAA